MTAAYIELFRAEDEVKTFRLLASLLKQSIRAHYFSLYFCTETQNETVDQHYVTFNKKLETIDELDVFSELGDERQMVIFSRDLQYSELLVSEEQLGFYIIPIVIDEKITAILQVGVSINQEVYESNKLFLITLSGLAAQFIKDNIQLHDTTILANDESIGEFYLFDEEHQLLYKELQELLKHPSAELSEVVQVISSIRRLLEN